MHDQISTHALRHDGQLDKSPPKSQYLLFTHYEHFFSDSSKEEVLSQWFELTKLILSSPGLVSRKCTRVMISGDTCLSNRVSRVTSTLTVVRLAAFLLLLAIDTSECERVFSLMSNIKSAHRAHVNQVACSTSIMGANGHFHRFGPSLPSPWPVKPPLTAARSI